MYRPGEPDVPTTWKTFIVTAGRLIHAELEFDAERYDLDAYIRQPSVTSRIIAAWTRRLHDITRIDIGKCEMSIPRSGPSGWFAVGDMTLVFADGQPVALPLNQEQLPNEEERNRSDDFLTALREGAGL